MFPSFKTFSSTLWFAHSSGEIAEIKLSSPLQHEAFLRESEWKEKRRNVFEEDAFNWDIKRPAAVFQQNDCMQSISKQIGFSAGRINESAGENEVAPNDSDLVERSNAPFFSPSPPPANCKQSHYIHY